MPDDKIYIILLVEDDAFLRNLLTLRLQKEGFQVETAVDGVECLEKMRAVRPQLILLDIILPRKNGFEVLQDMTEDPQLSQIPVVIISNLGQETDISRAKSLGVIEYYVKARLSIDELITKVRELLGAV